MRIRYLKTKNEKQKPYLTDIETSTATVDYHIINVLKWRLLESFRKLLLLLMGFIICNLHRHRRPDTQIN